MIEHEPKPVAWMLKLIRKTGVARLSLRPMEDMPELDGELWEEIPLYPESVVTALQEEVTAAEARANAAEQRMKEAVKALEPFADVADFVDEETQGFGMDDTLNIVMQDPEFPDFVIKSLELGKFFAARAFIKEAGE